MNTKMILLLVSMAFLGHPPSVSGQNLMWAKQVGGSSFNAGYAVAVDAQGATYMTGIFDGTTDFDPSAGRFELTADTFSTSIFIAKMAADGQFLWARSVVGQVLSLAVDAESVYIAGTFSGSVDFDPGTDTVWRESGGIETGFILKLDTDGRFQWVKTLSSTAFNARNAVTALALDDQGQLYAAGYFNQQADFGGSIVNSQQGSEDAFLVKYGPQGDLKWLKTWGQAGQDRVQGLAVRQNHVAVTGFFSGSFDYTTPSGLQSCRATGGTDGFVGKLDTTGRVFWIKNVGGQRTDEGRSIALTPQGDCYVMGYFEEWADFNPDLGVYPLFSTGLDDVFVMKWTANGQFSWAYALDAFTRETGQTVATDAANNCLILANFRESITWGNPLMEMVPLGFNDVFFLKISPNGQWLTAQCLAGFDNESGYGIATDAAGALYITGYFQGWLDADPSPAVFEMAAIGTYDAFLVKISNPTLLALDWVSVALQHGQEKDNIKGVLNISEGEKGQISLEKRRPDGRFEVVGQQPLSVQTSFSIEKTTEMAYYRLVALGNEGRPQYSKIVVQMPDYGQSIKAYPSVCRDFFQVDLPETAVFDLSVLSAQGQMVWQALEQTGQNRIDTHDWPSGVYVVRAQRQGQVWTQRVVKIP